MAEQPVDQHDQHSNFGRNFFVDCLLMIASGINAISLFPGKNCPHLNELDSLALSQQIPFHVFREPKQILPFRYLVWIVPRDIGKLQIWLNRIHFSHRGYVRLAWFPEADFCFSAPSALDFAVYGSSIQPISELFTAQHQAYNPFLDHINGLAFKNALGGWTIN